MKGLKLVRKTITANTAEKFEFDVRGLEFLVKNFNDFPIYVAFENTTDTDKMIKIPEQSSQICIMRKSTNPAYANSDVYVYADTAGEVEIQCINY